MATKQSRSYWPAGLILLFLFQPPATQQPQVSLEVTYIANEGFLLAAGDSKVIIDGLFREGIEPYAALSPAARDDLETAQPLFDGVQLVLVSHYHADHFDAAAVARYLVHNFRAVLVSSPQVADRVAEQLKDDVILRNRVRRVNPQGEGAVTLAVEGIGLKVQRVSHGRGRFAEIQNLGHLVTLGGWKILHIGDSDAGEAEFKRFGWRKEKIDVAFIPFWYLTDKKGSEVIRRYVRPRLVVAMHIPPVELEQRTAEIRATFPDAVIFTQPLETRTFD